MKLKIIVNIAFIIIFLVNSHLITKADEPLPPPADYSISSQNNKFEAFFDVKNDFTFVYKIEKVKRKVTKTKLWEMPGWYRNAFLSNDGENSIAVYDGANLLELDYKVNQVMISFYQQGKLLNEIRLNQLIKNPVPENLERTVSHYKWVSTHGLNNKQIFEVNTAAKKRFLFDIKTGLPSEGTLLYSADTKSGQAGTVKKSVEDSTEKTNNCRFALFLAAGLAVLLPEFTSKFKRF